MRTRTVARTFLLLTILFGLLSFIVIRYMMAPLHNFTEAKNYLYKPGTSLTSMLGELQANGVINLHQAVVCYWWLRITGKDKSLKAGNYLFTPDVSLYNLASKIQAGDVIQYSFTILEGTTFKQMMDNLNNNDNILHTVQDKTPQQIMAILGEPDKSPEGLFFPDTYNFTYKTKDTVILSNARKLMKDKLQQAWSNRSKILSINDPYEALILASIVEKEAALKVEQKHISGVFHRRINKRMRLQADPTVIFGLGQDFSGDLTRSHLRSKDNPYNTYARAGLPPTPIAFPGFDAIEAALNPDVGDSLYFVAKGDGSHFFSKELSEHNEAVKKYQLGQ